MSSEDFYLKNHFLVEISHHAREQMDERGANESEVLQAIQNGIDEPARKGRKMYRKNFQFNGLWRGRQYKVKQVVPVVAEEGNKLVVVTVYVFYF